MLINFLNSPTTHVAQQCIKSKFYLNKYSPVVKYRHIIAILLRLAEETW